MRRRPIWLSAVWARTGRRRSDIRGCCRAVSGVRRTLPSAPVWPWGTKTRRHSRNPPQCGARQVTVAQAVATKDRKDRKNAFCAPWQVNWRAAFFFAGFAGFVRTRWFPSTSNPRRFRGFCDGWRALSCPRRRLACEHRRTTLSAVSTWRSGHMSGKYLAQLRHPSGASPGRVWRESLRACWNRGSNCGVFSRKKGPGGHGGQESLCDRMQMRSPHNAESYSFFV